MRNFLKGLSPMALLTAIEPSIRDTPFLLVIRPFMFIILFISSYLSAFWSTVTLAIYPLSFMMKPHESPTFANETFPLCIRLMRSVDPSLRLYFEAISKKSLSS